MNFHYPRADPILEVSLAIAFLASSGLMPAHSEPVTISRCTLSIVNSDGSARERFRHDLKKIGADLATRNANIEGAVNAVGAASHPSSDSEQMRAFESRLEALSRAAHALEEQINTITSTTTTTCNMKKELNHE